MEKTFEQAVSRLEEIIENLERENLPFSQAQKLYEEGSGLVKSSLGMLEQAKEAFTVIKFELDKVIEEKFE